MIFSMMRTRAFLWLLPCLVASVILAADLARPSPSPAVAEPAPQPIPAERLVVAGPDGNAQSFADLLGPDGRAVCFAFLHPACPLAQEYAPVLGTWPPSSPGLASASWAWSANVTT
jgi:hypothetical protein